MDAGLKQKLISIAEERQTEEDPSHDIQHVKRVCNMAIQIAESVNADLEVVIPAALFHDIVVYPKNSPQTEFENEESAELAEQILLGIEDFPKEKIPTVKACIVECSFSKGTQPNSLESSVLQDADRLDACGAISILRTASSGGQMKRKLYDPEDPFCVQGAIKGRSNLDLFYRRLLIVGERMHTDYARKIAKRRTDFLHAFLAELKEDLRESKIIE